jgi:hypothetical protein
LFRFFLDLGGDERKRPFWIQVEVLELIDSVSREGGVCTRIVESGKERREKGGDQRTILFTSSEAHLASGEASVPVRLLRIRERRC